MYKYILLSLIGFGAGFVQRVSGFGLGIFAMIFLPHIMPANSAATVSTAFSMATTVYNTLRYRKNIDCKTALPMLIAAFVTIPFAVYYSTLVTGNVLKTLLGVVLVVLSIYFLVSHNGISIKPTTCGGLVAGASSGILGGIFSTGGPPIVLYLAGTISENIVYFATIQFYFCCTNAYSFVMRAANGIVTKDIIVYSVVGIVGCLIGDFAGKAVFDKLDSAKLKTVIYIGMLISGVLMFV